MLFSMQLLCFYKQPPSVFVQNINEAIFKEKRFITNNPFSYSFCGKVHALKEGSESQQYEVDPDKAREALQNLDDQIQSLSNKQPSTPKLRVSDVKIPTDQVNGRSNEKLEISDSFLASLATGLVLFTVFYNVLFYTVIKPAIDGP